MGRKPGFDQNKIERIAEVLVANPDGIWISRIAEQTKLHPSTVTKYLEGVLAPLVEDVSLAGRERPILRIVKLKSFVIERLQEGKTIDEILRLFKYFNE